MPESLLNFRFRGTTLPYEELLVALEHITIDKVTTRSTSKVKKIDTSAPVEIGMAPGTDGEETFEEETPHFSRMADKRPRGQYFFLTNHMRCPSVCRSVCLSLHVCLSV